MQCTLGSLFIPINFQAHETVAGQIPRARLQGQTTTQGRQVDETWRYAGKREELHCNPPVAGKQRVLLAGRARQGKRSSCRCGVGGGDVQRVEVALVHGYDGNSFSSRAFWLELGSPRP